MSVPVVPSAPAGVVGCEPEVRTATGSVYYLQNRRKRRNFIVASLTGAGYLHFHAENLPKDGTGCPGKWMFEAAWDYLVGEQKVVIRGVRGDWTWGDNLDTVNRLTAGGAMSLEEACKRTWTYQRAASKGFGRYQYIDARGSPGKYVSVDVVFLP